MSFQTRLETIKNKTATRNSRKGGVMKKFLCVLPNDGGVLLLKRDTGERVWMRSIPPGTDIRILRRQPQNADIACGLCGGRIHKEIEGWEWWSGDEEPVFVTRYEDCTNCGSVWIHDGQSGFVEEPHMSKEGILAFIDGKVPNNLHLNVCRRCRRSADGR